MALRKFIAPNLLTRSIINPSRASSCYLNIRSIANVFRTAFYYIKDCHPSAPITMISHVLNKLESGILRPPSVQGRWMVWQNTEALMLHRHISKHGKEEVKVSVERNSYIIFGPGYYVSKNLGTGSELGIEMNNDSNSFGLCGAANQPAVLIIECKLLLGDHEEEEEGEDFDTYTMWIDLECELYITSAIKIEETNKVLKISVPKLKPKWIHKGSIKWDPIRRS